MLQTLQKSKLEELNLINIEINKVNEKKQAANVTIVEGEDIDLIIKNSITDIQTTQNNIDDVESKIEKLTDVISLIDAELSYFSSLNELTDVVEEQKDQLIIKKGKYNEVLLELSIMHKRFCIKLDELRQTLTRYKNKKEQRDKFVDENINLADVDCALTNYYQKQEQISEELLEIEIKIKHFTQKITAAKIDLGEVTNNFDPALYYTDIVKGLKQTELPEPFIVVKNYIKFYFLYLYNSYYDSLKNIYQHSDKIIGLIAVKQTIQEMCDIQLKQVFSVVPLSTDIAEKTIIVSDL